VRPCEQRDQNRNQRPQAAFVALSAIGLARTNFLVGTGERETEPVEYNGERSDRRLDNGGFEAGSAIVRNTYEEIWNDWYPASSARAWVQLDLSNELFAE
jgi:hypothetical protein